MPVTAAINEGPQEAIRRAFQLALTFEAAEKDSLKRADTSKPASLARIDGPTIAVTRNDKSLKQRFGSQGRKNRSQPTIHQVCTY